MVLQLLKQSKPVTQPIVNERNSLNLSFDDMQRRISARIMESIKGTPELVGILDTVVTDHFQGPIDFFDVDGNALGPTNLRKAQRKWSDWNVMQAFQGQGFDYFVDGSSFGWWNNIANALDAKQKESIKNLISGIKTKSFGSFDLSGEMNLEVEEPKKISYLAASTTEIIHDAQSILGYRQEAAGREKIWKPEQVVHIKLMEFNGEIRSFSGLKALIKEIAIMYMLKENIMAKLGNGGSADNIISLKNANGVSKARFKRLRTALESFSHLRKSHGNMPVDGEVNVHALGTSLKDMEYRELAMFVISEFALAVGVPTSRIPFLMTGAGGTTNKGELSGNSEDAYQKKINNRRANWEQKWNKVFRKAKFMFKFRRDNLQDSVRETQASVQRSAYVTANEEIWRKRKKKLTENAVLQLLSGTKMNIDQADIEDMSPEEIEEMKGPMEGEGGPNGNDLKNKDIESKSKVTLERSEAKSRTATNNGVTA